MPSPLSEASQYPNSVLLVTSRRAHESRKSYLFTHPEKTFTLTHLSDLPQLYSDLDSTSKTGLYAAGFFGYECGYGNEDSLLSLAPETESSTPLAWFGFYRTPRIFDYVPEEVPEFPPPDPQLDISKDSYFRKFNQIKENIKAGNTYQVNLTTRLTWSHIHDPATLFAHIMTVQPVEFGALIHLENKKFILSASPELFFRRLGDEIVTRPMKGTCPRGFSLAEQRENSTWLEKDEKNRSENIMIVDLLRNDLRKISQVNTVTVTELCSIEIYPTVLQMVSTIRAKLRPKIPYSEIFRALFPCGSITGAPKVRTMKIIRDLEDRPRGVYTGSIGFISPHEEAVFSVAIRTMVLDSRRGEGEMGIGGGIVWDSEAGEEFDECRLKGSFLTKSSEGFDIFETMLWEGGEGGKRGEGYVFLEDHLRRLRDSAEYFEFGYEEGEVRRLLEEVGGQFRGDKNQRVRLLLTQKGGIRITSTEIPPKLLNGTTNGTTDHGLKVLVSTERTNPKDLFLRHKTTRRALYDREFQTAISSNYEDILFLNTDGFFTESAIRNLIVVKDGQWITPPVSDGLLPGVLRASLLERGDMVERSLRLEELMGAEEVYLGNSVRGLQKVGRIEMMEGGKMVTIWEEASERG